MKLPRILLPILSVLTVILISCQNSQQGTLSVENSQNLIVLVKYKTLPSMSEDAIAGLTKLIEAVKNEPNFVNITLHTDPKNSSNILLYEEWSDKAYYNGDHMNTKHLRSFMEDSRAYLAGPPEISQWKIEKTFSSR
jgi:quinol monooxygenase YgiN